MNTALKLTEAQYNTLSEFKNIFDLLSVGVLDLPNPSMEWLQKFAIIYTQVFQGSRPNIGCRPCRLDAVRAMLYPFKDYERSLETLKTPINTIPDQLIITDATPTSNPTDNTATTDKDGTHKSRGRQPKQWK